MKKRQIFLTALALVMVAASGLGSAMAYFTTHTEALGGYTVRLGSRTDIHEEFSDWTKRVAISNEAGSQPVYVRARAFAGGAYELVYSSKSGKWTDGGDGWQYYGDLLNGGEITDGDNQLLVEIKGVPADAADGDSFDVVVVYESTPVLYDADGKAYADWNVKVETAGERGGTNP